MNLSFLICTWKQQYLPLTAVVRNDKVRRTFSVPRLPKEASLSAIVGSGGLPAFPTPVPTPSQTTLTTLFSNDQSAYLPQHPTASPRGENRPHLFCSQFYWLPIPDTEEAPINTCWMNRWMNDLKKELKQMEAPARDFQRWNLPIHIPFLIVF